MPWDIQKNNYPSNSNRSRFIYFFQFDLGCTLYICFHGEFFGKFTEEKRLKASSEGNLEDLTNNPKKKFLVWKTISGSFSVMGKSDEIIVLL